MKHTNHIRCALAQINPLVGDIKGNTRKILACIKQAVSQQANLVVFPELAITGYPPEDLLFKKRFVENSMDAYNTIRASNRGIVSILGFPHKHQGNLYNGAGIIGTTGLSKVYHKMRLPNYGVFDEKRYFTPGNQLVLFSVRGIKMAVNICEDLWDPHGPTARQRQLGAQLVINISASPFHWKKASQRKRLAGSLAKKNHVPLVYLNMVGGQDELVFDGGSFVLDHTGKTIHTLPSFAESLAIVDIPIETKRGQIRGTGMPVPYSNRVGNGHARSAEKKVPVPFFFSVYYDLETRPRNHYRFTQTKPVKKRTPKQEKQIYDALVLGTRDYTHKNGFDKVVLGVSGGIDSALVAAIAVDALGPENVVTVSMPGPYSSPGSRSDAAELAGNLGVKLLTIPITKPYQAFLATLKSSFQGMNQDVTEENLQARVRGTILMALSNKFHYLVLSTGNKSEGSMGYCTLYGDMVGGLSVIKDLPKQWVYRLSCYRNQEAEYNYIPQAILDKEPSAELRPNQKDSDSLPPYHILDTIVEAYVEKEQDIDTITTKTPFSKRTIKDIVAHIDRNEYKRRQSPPGIKISPKAFGRDRRMPITNGYK